MKIEIKLNLISKKEPYKQRDSGMLYIFTLDATSRKSWEINNFTIASRIPLVWAIKWDIIAVSRHAAEKLVL